MCISSPLARVEAGLLQLMAIRAAQISGCAPCARLHTRLARDADVAEEKIRWLPVWRDAPSYSERERAALAWAEAVTRVREDAKAR